MPLTGPIGLTPFGLAPPVPGVDAPSGLAVLSRFIDPVARDYQLDEATGQFASMPPVRQRVMLATGTDVGTSAVIPDLGIEKTPVIDAQYQRTEQTNARAAMQHLLDERVVRIRNITAEGSSSGRARTLIEYTDLTQSENAESRTDEVETPTT
jgi:hypothetical protein